MYPGNTEILLKCLRQNERQQLANELRKSNSLGIKIAHDELNWKAFTLSCVEEDYNKLKFFSAIFLQNCFDEAVFDEQMERNALDGRATLKCLRLGNLPTTTLFSNITAVLKVPKERVLIYRCLMALDHSRAFERDDHANRKDWHASRKETIPVQDTKVLNTIESKIKTTFQEHISRKFKKLEINLIILFLYCFAVWECSRTTQWCVFGEEADKG